MFWKDISARFSVYGRRVVITKWSLWFLTTQNIPWFCDFGFACSQATGMGLMHEAHMEISSLFYREDQFQQSCLSIFGIKTLKPVIKYIFLLKLCCLAWHAHLEQFFWDRGFQQCWTCARRKWVSSYVEISRNIYVSGLALKWGCLEFVKMLWPRIYNLPVLFWINFWRI